MLNKRFSGYQILINVIMIIWCIIIVVPFLLVLLSSLTSENALVRNGYSFFPEEFSLAAYTYIFKNGAKIFKAYGVTIITTVIGVIGNVLLSGLMAYPLAVKNIPGKKFMSFFVFFTMLFNGGIVPSYLIWSGVFHIKDTIWAQILPGMFLSAWNVMMVRTYFTTSIPESLYEAAEIDGASQFRIFAQIVVPLGKPILVTIGTFAGLGYWNSWTNALYYIVKNKDLYNIQNLLNEMVTNLQFLQTSTDANAAALAATIPSTAIQMAIAFVAILPIMIIFPFFEKYYAKGITLGGVKG